MQFLPALLLTIPAGQLVDRVDRRGVLAASLVVQAVVALVLDVGQLRRLGRPRPHLRAVRGDGHGARAADAAQQAIVPALVPLAQLPRAFALTSTFLTHRDHRRAGARRLHLRAGSRGGLRHLPRTARGRRPYSSARSSAFHRPKQRSACRSTRCSRASASSGTRSRCWARSRSISSRCCWAARRRCCRSTRRTCCTPGRGDFGLLRGAPSVGALAMALFLARVPLQRHVGRRMFVAVAVYGVGDHRVRPVAQLPAVAASRSR